MLLTNFSTETQPAFSPALGSQVTVTPLDERFETTITGQLSELSHKVMSLTLSRPLPAGCLIKVEHRGYMWLGEVLHGQPSTTFPGQHTSLLKLEHGLRRFPAQSREEADYLQVTPKTKRWTVEVEQQMAVSA
jgi:hypothetical protein